MKYDCNLMLLIISLSSEDFHEQKANQWLQRSMRKFSANSSHKVSFLIKKKKEDGEGIGTK